MPEPQSASSIRLDTVTLDRSGRRVLDALSLDLPERRIGLVGRNGSGKSSLVRLLNGLLEPTAGRVTVHGQEAGAEASMVGFIFQNADHQLIFPTVAEEVAFSLEMAGRARKQAKAQALAYLESQGIADWADRPVHHLSEGQKQWLCILAVLVGEPKVLVLDEPFSSLDLANRLALLRRIDALDQQVLLISHDLDALNSFDRILWLEEGRLRADGPPAEILPAYRADALDWAESQQIGDGPGGRPC
ncbi:MAG: energy-coupling factor ABC transporter ATP-binding protein [Rhodospirillales bacterium]